MKLFGLSVISTFLLIVLVACQQQSEPKILLTNEAVASIPKGSVHWHPQLEIKIDGKQIPIPTGIGVKDGRVVDAHLSGMKMSPTHTHESDGTIHLENNNPSSKPETVTLGYFFYVWDKQFNSTCIFEYCIGTLKMTVNDKESSEFERYVMRDKDKIIIEYTSN